MLDVVYKLEQLERSFLNKINVKLIKTAVFSTFVFSMFANAFVYFNFYPQHDSINHAFRFAGKWEVSLGRFLLPLYGKIGGDVTLPWLEGIFSILFISFSVYLISEILEFDENWQIILISGFLSANVCITELASTFIYVLSAYMLSVLLACLGTYLLVKNQSVEMKVLAVICLVCSLGLYQGEIVIAIVLLLLVLMKDAFANYRFTALLKKWIPIGATMICVAVIYYFLYRFSLAVYDIEPANSYNSLSNLEEISMDALISAGIGCYKAFLSFFYGKECVVGTIIARSCNIIFSLMALIGLLHHLFVCRMHWYNKIIMIMVILVFPGIVCMMDIIMLQENLDFYILYALFMNYIACLLIIKECTKELQSIHCSGIVKRGAVICFTLIMFQNILFSNQTYVYQKVLYDRATSITGRILNNIDSCPEYEAGVTEVVLIGTLQKNDELAKLTENRSLSGGNVLSITYNQTFGSFVTILGSKFNWNSDAELMKEYRQKEEIINMPSYPKDGYWKMIDDKMVIKLSK